jgi:hypothetical protein
VYKKHVCSQATSAKSAGTLCKVPQKEYRKRSERCSHAGRGYPIAYLTITRFAIQLGVFAMGIN